AAALIEANQAAASLGSSVAGAGDVNGDGDADGIIGAHGYDSGQTEEGTAFVFLGNSEGRPILARQRRSGESGTPVQPYGWSHSTNALQLEIHATHSAGRGKVKGEFQVCPPSVAFGNASCTTGTTS